MSRLAAINYARGFDIDRLVIDVAKTATSAGLIIGGLVQLSTGERGGNCATTTHVIDLRSNTSFDIWEDRGACARGCRLDENGLADAEPVLIKAIDDQVDLLFINRFGRAESLGRGLRPFFEAALARGISVLTAVRAPYEDAWCEFHGGVGHELPCSHPRITAWALANASHRASANA